MTRWRDISPDAMARLQAGIRAGAKLARGPASVLEHRGPRKGLANGQKRLGDPSTPAAGGKWALWFPGLPLVYEYRFAPPRRFRFDAALPQERVAVEMDGGAWIQGRHTRGAGFIRDLEKLNLAVLLGWRVLRYTPQQIEDGTAYRDLSRLLNLPG